MTAIKEGNNSPQRATSYGYDYDYDDTTGKELEWNGNDMGYDETEMGMGMGTGWNMGKLEKIGILGSKSDTTGYMGYQDPWT